MRRRLIAGGLAAGAPGIVAVTLLLLPAMLAGKPLPMPLWALQLIALLQSFLLLAVAAVAGACLAPRTGLRAPLLSAWACRAPLGQAIRPAIVPGLAGGVVGAAALYLASRAAPVQMHIDTPIPVLARLLYGGITEELLMRWGLMTLIAWIIWRLFQHRAEHPSPAVIAASIVLSALMFGAGHLPAAATLVGHLTAGVIAYVVIANAVFGVIAGWLYWTVGLEAAILAHITTHLCLLL
jgi:membrane protease YdiL (CAAX protease family)